MDDYVDSIFTHTRTDRVLMLVATTSEPFVISVIYERHKASVGIRSRYKRTPADQEYRKMLSTIELLGKVEIDTSDMSESSLKDVYVAEGITASVIHYMGKVTIDGDTPAILFFSFSTHDEEKLNKRDLDYISVLFGSIKEILRVYLKF